MPAFDLPAVPPQRARRVATNQVVRAVVMLSCSASNICRVHEYFNELEPMDPIWFFLIAFAAGCLSGAGMSIWSRHRRNDSDRVTQWPSGASRHNSVLGRHIREP